MSIQFNSRNAIIIAFSPSILMYFLKKYKEVFTRFWTMEVTEIHKLRCNADEKEIYFDMLSPSNGFACAIL